MPIAFQRIALSAWGSFKGKLSLDMYNKIQKKGENFQKKLTFYHHDKLIEGEWEVIGQYEGLSFIKLKNVLLILI